MNNNNTDPVETEPPCNNFLVYPNNFFNEANGRIPQEKESAASFWRYRKNWPTTANDPNYVADGESMLKEMKEIRDSLINFTSEKVDNKMLMLAKEYEIKLPNDQQKPINRKDLKNALASLKHTSANELIVYRIIFEWSKDKEWVANVVDEWLLKNKMRLESTNELNQITNKIRKLGMYYRGGFGACCRAKKNDIQKTISRFMLNSAGWTIGVKHCPTANTTEFKKYGNIGGKTYSYYLVRLNHFDPHKKRKNYEISSNEVVNFLCVHFF